MTIGNRIPRFMLRQSVLSAVKDQRQALIAGVGKADQIKLDQYFTSVREMENQLAIQLQKPEHCEACVVPTAPKDTPRSATVDAVRANTLALAKLLAMGLACNQTKVFNFVHTAGSSETYLAGQSKIYHQITQPFKRGPAIQRLDEEWRLDHGNRGVRRRPRSDERQPCSGLLLC